MAIKPINRQCPKFLKRKGFNIEQEEVGDSIKINWLNCSKKTQNA